MIKIAALLSTLSFTLPLFSARGDLISFTKVVHFNKSDLQGLQRQYSMQELPLTAESAELYRIIYETIDPQGTPTKCSGAIVVPKGTMTKYPLVSFNHGTMCSRFDVPSRINFQLLAAISAFTTGSYLLVSTDYLGLGESELSYHPYCHADSLASSSKDMLIAAKSFFAQKEISWDGSLFISGYSEGGMAAMALHRELETHKDPSFMPTASCPMAGPYDLSESSLQIGLSVPNPRASTYLAFLLKGYNMLYSGLFSSFAECFEAPYFYTISVLMDGTQSMFDIQHALPLDPKALLKKEYLDKVLSNPSAPLRARLRENDTYRWVPKAPMQLVGAKGDKDVAFANAEVAYQWMKEKGAKVTLINIGDQYDHLTGASICHMQARKFFDSKKSK